VGTIEQRAINLLVVSERLPDNDEVHRPVAGRGLRCDVVPCTLDAWRQAHWMRGAGSATPSTRASSCMANPRRVHALPDMADEDLAGARALVDVPTRLARYHVQQSAEKAAQ